ncbi:MAG: hypothetical protein COX34_02055, partial [Candidatus Nealsonbacteria bacterium CG23_combo_of_CG06-09_8_20_14_all_36_12]
MKNFSKIIIILSIFSLILPNFSFVFAQVEMKTVKMPESIKEAKEMGKGFLGGLPNIFKEIWQEGSRIGIWMYQKALNIWDTYIFPWLDKYVLQKIEKRKPLIEEEFQKEKTEMKKEIKQ